MIRSSVEDLIKYTTGEAIHLEGDLTREYVEMLALYALYRERNHPAAKVILDSISKYEMSDGLISGLKETVEKYRK